MDDKTPSHARHNMVGPVLMTSAASDAIVEAIREAHPELRVEDEGSYVRVLVPGRCTVTRTGLEATIGRPIRFPAELEMIMASYKGRLSMNDDEAVWEA